MVGNDDGDDFFDVFWQALINLDKILRRWLGGGREFFAFAQQAIKILLLEVYTGLVSLISKGDVDRSNMNAQFFPFGRRKRASSISDDRNFLFSHEILQ